MSSPDLDLAARLADLGDHLAIPATPQMAAEVLARIDAGDTSSAASRRWVRRLAAAAVAFLVAFGGLFAYQPTRHAIASWLGIGTVRITQVPSLPPVGTTPATPAQPATGTPGIADAQRKVGFAIRVPDSVAAGGPHSVEVDTAVPGGLVSIAYDRFTLTEIAAKPDQQPIMSKLVDPSTRLSYLTVNGRDGVWIDGAPHEWGYIDPDGNFRNETLRRAGNVLLWEDGGITFRIEGLASKDDALTVAATLR